MKRTYLGWAPKPVTNRVLWLRLRGVINGVSLVGWYVSCTPLLGYSYRDLTWFNSTYQNHKAGSTSCHMDQHFNQRTRQNAAGWQRHSLQRHHSWPEVLKTILDATEAQNCVSSTFPWQDPCNEQYKFTYMNSWYFYWILWILWALSYGYQANPTEITAPFLPFFQQKLRNKRPVRQQGFSLQPEVTLRQVTDDTTFIKISLSYTLG